MFVTGYSLQAQEAKEAERRKQRQPRYGSAQHSPAGPAQLAASTAGAADPKIAKKNLEIPEILKIQKFLGVFFRK